VSPHRCLKVPSSRVPCGRVLAPTCISTLELECGQALTHGSRPPEAWGVTAGEHGISTAAGHIVEHLPHGELVHTRISKCGGARMTYCLPRQLADGCQIAPAYIFCAVSRVTAPAVSSSLNAKGRDSLHKVDVPDRVLVCTACGTCSTFTGKPPKLPMGTVLREEESRTV
jgi:hypothetical protein